MNEEPKAQPYATADGGGPAYVARNFGVQEVTEGTALALMQDMLQEAK